MKIRHLLSASTLALLANLSAQAEAPRAELVRRYIELCSWLTDVPYTPEQRAELRQQVEAYWRLGDQARIDTVLRSMDMHVQLVNASPAVRETTLAKVRPGVLVSLQEDAAKGSDDSAWLYEQFLRANPPLAQGHQGSIPLTRDMVDAALDYEYFIKVTVLNRAGRAVAQASREAAYVAAARNYRQLTTEQQLEVAAQPGRLIEERNLWQAAGPQVRALMRAQMGGELTGEDQALIAAFHQAQSGAGWVAVQSQLDAMTENSRTIMGGGTTWNSSLGRWEQHGGIVTEYDSGVVRVR